MQTLRLKQFLILGLLGVIFLGLTPQNAHAQEQELVVQGVRVSPFIFEQSLEKGHAFNGEITLTNTTNSPITLALAVQDFIPAGRHGEVRFLPTNEQSDVHFSLTDWVQITTQPNYTLAPGATTKTGFTVTAPVDADDSTHYGGIVFSFNNGKTENGTAIIQSVGALLIVKIGHSNGQGTIQSFTTPQRVYTNSRVPFRVNFENTGNTHLSPKGKIEIYNAFNKLVGVAYINKDAQISLPNTIREFDSEYQGGFMLGKYTANLTMYFGNPKLEARSVVQFWIIPWKPILKTTGLTILLIALLTLAIIRYNTWVIKKARKA